MPRFLLPKTEIRTAQVNLSAFAAARYEDGAALTSELMRGWLTPFYRPGLCLSTWKNDDRQEM